jgi:hypothetical protein
MKKARKHNWEIVQRYQREKWYLLVILFFILCYFVLRFFDTPVISPCSSMGCAVKMVYAKSDLTIQEQVLIGGVREFGLDNAQSLLNIVTRESNFHPNATNSSSSACGLFQALPCEKMKCDLGDIDCQIKWGLNYIRARYKDPNGAWDFWKVHHWF